METNAYECNWFGLENQMRKRNIFFSEAVSYFWSQRIHEWIMMLQQRLFLLKLGQNKTCTKTSIALKQMDKLNTILKSTKKLVY